MERLYLISLSSDSIDEPSAEEKRLINALVRSDITKLTHLDLNFNASWFVHIEALSHMLDFIREQTCL